jgi:hypothetical protein
MSRNFTHPRAGNFCIQVEKYDRRKMILYYELLHLDKNKVEKQGHLHNHKTIESTKIEFGYLQAGNYQLTLRNISTDILSVELCPG